MSIDPKPDSERIVELRRKIREEEYLSRAIQEIALLLTESINRSHFLLHERK
jgi:hypothetical protein